MTLKKSWVLAALGCSARRAPGSFPCREHWHLRPRPSLAPRPPTLPPEAHSSNCQGHHLVVGHLPQRGRVERRVVCEQLAQVPNPEMKLERGWELFRGVPPPTVELRMEGLVGRRPRRKQGQPSRWKGASDDETIEEPRNPVRCCSTPENMPERSAEYIGLPGHLLRECRSDGSQ